VKVFFLYSIIAFCVLLTIHFDYHVYTAVIVACAYILTMFINRNNPNIVHLCCFLLLFKAIEQFVFLFVPFTAGEGELPVWTNNTIYMIHVSFDVALLFTLWYRGFLSRYIYSKLDKPIKGLHLTFADIGLFLVVVLFVIVDLYAAIENLVRNMEHLGIPEDVAKEYWKVNWMFYNYSDIKRWLMGAEFLAIWTMISAMAKREFKLKV